jgi:acyl-CoA thioester hydrolase
MIWKTEIQTRFSDYDSMGHVNNAIYFSYMETARMDVFAKIFGPNRNWKKLGFILRTNQIEYLQQLKMGIVPEIHMFCQSIGNSSFTLGYKIQSGDTVFAEASSVLVTFDFETQKSIPVPEDLRAHLEASLYNSL